MRRIDIAIVGMGGVGREVARLLYGRQARYARLYGVDVRLVAVCGSRSGRAKPSGLRASELDDLIPGQCGPDFLLGAQPQVLIEAGPTNIRTGQPGLDYIGRALDRGVHAVVISKGALVVDGKGLQARAAANDAILKVSGATAAALPTIDLLEYGLMGCEVSRVEGILNATTNHLLSAMAERGVSFDNALLEAQQKGMAEADPRQDVEGWDTAAKLLILANLGLGAELRLDDIRVKGMEHVTPQIIGEWRDQGKVPKLIGRLTLQDGEYRASVGVEPIASDDVFALVTGKTKALRVHTDLMGEIVSIGCGAEPTATAAAALKDLEHLLKKYL